MGTLTCKSIIGSDNALLLLYISYTRFLSMKSLSIIIKSDDGIELGSVTITKQDWMAARVNRTSGRGKSWRWFD